MGRGLPKKVKSLLEKSREAALLAVEVYNKPNTTFRTGVYIILMNIAWTSLYHKENIKRLMEKGKHGS